MSVINLSNLNFCDDLSVPAQAVTGKGIQAPSVSVGATVGFQPAISLNTNITYRSAIYSYGVAYGAGAATSLSLNGTAVAGVVVGASIR